MEDSLALRKAILEGIARRDAHLPTEGQTSYAAAVKGIQEVATPVSTEKPQHQTQARNSLQQPGSQNAFTVLPTANHPGEEESIDEGSITVTRRKHCSLEKKRKSAPKLNKHIELLKAQGRCYRCLDRGHTQFQCRNDIRCNNCHGIGHMSRACTVQKNLSTSTPPAFQRTTFLTKQNPKTETNQYTMNLDNWETMPMLSPSLINPGPRPEPRPTPTEHPPEQIGLGSAGIKN
ncbi:Zinc knuckle [Carex littledalei]|uniref:Zinc knuckle n=1 Tax=Carex littledalei TaxID=544730 RepID=A0A833QP38_9POAL|nr:Zinc knuckle [Carex littledalei]